MGSKWWPKYEVLVNILTNLLSVDFGLLSSDSDVSKSTYFGHISSNI